MSKSKEEIKKKKDSPKTEDANKVVPEEEEIKKGETEKEREIHKEEEEINVKYMRLAADFQNFKRRAERERSEIYARANEKIVTELLDVMDNFERALDNGANGENNGFKEGMDMIFAQLKAVMESAGVKEIESEGVEFDPNYHNAVMMEDSDEVESGKISSVLQKGYMLNGRVIRAAIVKVAN